MAALIAVLVAAPLSIAHKPAPKPLKPPVGKYKLDTTAGTGGFRVSEDKEIVKLSVTPSDDRDEACGRSKIKVKGKLKLSTTHRGGFAAWIYGKHDEKTHDYKERKVTLVIEGKEVSGTLKMIFNYDNVKRGNGELRFGDCYLHSLFYVKSK